MVEIITGVTLAARVVFFIASYRGYKAESKKEDDMLLPTKAESTNATNL